MRGKRVRKTLILGRGLKLFYVPMQLWLQNKLVRKNLILGRGLKLSECFPLNHSRQMVRKNLILGRGLKRIAMSGSGVYRNPSERP